MRKIQKYKGWTIRQGTETSADGAEHVIYQCYTPKEMQYPASIRSAEWTACSLREAIDFIDSYPA
ncbi:MAG TPA: hypothetical protein PKA28_10970 [Methylomusa anaerophila]|nr:hypothetical protein [Methylomusa anaerophila]HML88957.1 hypothetical protein [Methylomusa anaerophila]